MHVHKLNTISFTMDSPMLCVESGIGLLSCCTAFVKLYGYPLCGTGLANSIATVILNVTFRVDKQTAFYSTVP